MFKLVCCRAIMRHVSRFQVICGRHHIKSPASEDPRTTRPASSILRLRLDTAPPRPLTFLAPVVVVVVGVVLVVGVVVGVVRTTLYGVVVGKPPAFPRGDVVGVVAGE